jgi:NAD-dependent SIR2 family protein deacetylase
MAHFTCSSCRARVRGDGPADTQTLDRCPGCGGPLHAVEEPVVRTRPHGRRSIADQVRDTIARNDAARRRRLRATRLDPPRGDSR